MSALFPQFVPERARDTSGPIENESEISAGVRIEPGKQYGFFTDTTLCIGCKACEVACKEWNVLPAEEMKLTGNSYDNTGSLGATTWRHVSFIEKIKDPNSEPVTAMQPFQSNWLMLSDVCKHCENAACLESCPTGALFRTEFDTVVVQQDICNGCGYCIPACPFGVVAINNVDGKAHKCTLCYDRLKGGLEPACAKSCPTNSIQFGELSELKERARRRVESLRDRGVDGAHLYGIDEGSGTTGGIGDLHAFFLLANRPEVYNLPSAPSLPSRRIARGMLTGLGTMAAFAVAAAVAFFDQKSRTSRT
jgi:formate dehydrogenase iron-sulfur subunit